MHYDISPDRQPHIQHSGVYEFTIDPKQGPENTRDQKTRGQSKTRKTHAENFPHFAAKQRIDGNQSKYFSENCKNDRQSETTVGPHCEIIELGQFEGQIVDEELKV